MDIQWRSSDSQAFASYGSENRPAWWTPAWRTPCWCARGSMRAHVLAQRRGWTPASPRTSHARGAGHSAQVGHPTSNFDWFVYSQECTLRHPSQEPRPSGWTRVERHHGRPVPDLQSGSSPRSRLTRGPAEHARVSRWLPRCLGCRWVPRGELHFSQPTGRVEPLEVAPARPAWRRCAAMPVACSGMRMGGRCRISRVVSFRRLNAMVGVRHVRFAGEGQPRLGLRLESWG